MKDKTIQSHIFIALKGFVIGIANIIPGVSGGTMALVLGVYERMINSINHFSFHTVASVFKALSFRRRHIDAFKKEMKQVDMLFLLLLLLGIAAAFVAFSRMMTALLETRHEVTYGFFFGLILASIAVPYSIIRRKNAVVFAVMAIGVAVVVLISVAIPDAERIRMAQDAAASEASAGLDFGHASMVFVTGILSTSAMILPGISGSFVSLLLGQYFFLLQAVTEADFAVLGLYAVGAVIGLKLLVKGLDYLFRKFHDGLMAFLTGLVIGSLYVTWPFKNMVVVGGETLYLSNALPKTFALNEWLTLGTALLGVVIVFLVIRLNRAYGRKTGRRGTKPMNPSDSIEVRRPDLLSDGRD